MFFLRRAVEVKELRSLGTRFCGESGDALRDCPDAAGAGHWLKKQGRIVAV